MKGASQEMRKQETRRLLDEYGDRRVGAGPEGRLRTWTSSISSMFAGCVQAARLIDGQLYGRVTVTVVVR